jgi:hypothetical protein
MVTVNAVLPVTELSAAITEVEPDATAVARPVPAMVATAVFEILQVAVEVTLAVDLSLYVAVAVNCFVEPMAKLAEVGVMASDETVFAVTVKTVDPLMPPNEAVMVVVPSTTDVASPVALIVAVAVVELVQVAVEVTTTVEASL